MDLQRDIQKGERDLERDLEATVLQNYLQLTLGNIEAYSDSIARIPRDRERRNYREIVLVGIGPRDLAVGLDPPGRKRDRRPFRTRSRPYCSDFVSATAPMAKRAGTSAIASSDDGQEAVEATPEGNGAADSSRETLLCTEFIAKKLDLQLYCDSSVAWVSDEIDYRVPHRGRQAAIPLRFTALLIRDSNRWVVVMEHTSYALPRDMLLSLASAGKLSQPIKMANLVRDGIRHRLLRKPIARQLTADAASVDNLAEKLTRKYGPEPDPDDPTDTVPADRNLGCPRGKRQPDLLPSSNYLVLHPWSSAEYRGRETFTAPSLAQALGGPGALANITIDSRRLSIAANKRVAWMVANLKATVAAAGDAGGARRNIEIGLRATFVFAFDATSGWNVVQTHISVPVTEAHISERVFGTLGSGTPDTDSHAELARDRGRDR